MANGSFPQPVTGFDEDRFRRELVYSRKAVIAELQADLERIKNLDVYSQQQASKFGTRGALAAVGSIACVVGVVASLINGFVAGAVIAGGLLFVGIFFAVAWLRKYSFHRKTDVENKRYELAGELLRYLGVDIKPESEVELRIDFHNYYNTAYRTERVGNSSTYQLPWLSMSGKFADGNRFEFSAELKVKRKEKPKRKYTKVKEDATQELTLELALRNPPADSALSDHLLTVPPPPLDRYRAQVHGGKLILRASTGKRRTMTGRGGVTNTTNAAMAERDEFLRLFLTAYHCWNTFPRKAA
jgi:hypothetical protein